MGALVDAEPTVETGASERLPFEVDSGLLAGMAKKFEICALSVADGLATKWILRREWEVFGKGEYQRLAGISVSHLYNMRHSEAYRKHAIYLAPTRPTAIANGERRCPDPRGQPGYLRVDTVHQGDQDGRKGVYHINAVDTVTRWEVVGCTAKISERYLIPVLEAILHQFPFRILGFHADTGSEYINGD